MRDRARVVARRKRTRQRMFFFIQRHKTRRGCARCGGTDPGQPLEFDHIIPRYLGGRPAKPVTRNPMRWWRIAMYMVHPNIQVLCRQCHVAKTRQEDAS